MQAAVSPAPSQPGVRTEEPGFGRRHLPRRSLASGAWGAWDQSPRPRCLGSPGNWRRAASWAGHCRASPTLPPGQHTPHTRWPGPVAALRPPHPARGAEAQGPSAAAADVARGWGVGGSERGRGGACARGRGRGGAGREPRGPARSHSDARRPHAHTRPPRVSAGTPEACPAEPGARADRGGGAGGRSRMSFQGKKSIPRITVGLAPAARHPAPRARLPGRPLAAPHRDPALRVQPPRTPGPSLPAPAPSRAAEGQAPRERRADQFGEQGARAPGPASFPGPALRARKARGAEAALQMGAQMCPLRAEASGSRRSDGGGRGGGGRTRPFVGTAGPPPPGPRRHRAGSSLSETKQLGPAAGPGAPGTPKPSAKRGFGHPGGGERVLVGAQPAPRRPRPSGGETPAPHTHRCGSRATTPRPGNKAAPAGGREPAGLRPNSGLGLSRRAGGLAGLPAGFPRHRGRREPLYSPVGRAPASRLTREARRRPAPG